MKSPLTEDEVKLILELKESGLDAGKIAERLGVDPGRIYPHINIQTEISRKLSNDEMTSDAKKLKLAYEHFKDGIYNSELIENNRYFPLLAEFYTIRTCTPNRARKLSEIHLDTKSSHTFAVFGPLGFVEKVSTRNRRISKEGMRFVEWVYENRILQASSPLFDEASSLKNYCSV